MHNGLPPVPADCRARPHLCPHRGEAGAAGAKRRAIYHAPQVPTRPDLKRSDRPSRLPQSCTRLLTVFTVDMNFCRLYNPPHEGVD
jgi:hypothetical protein